MPIRRGRGWAPVAVIMFAGLAGALLGVRKGSDTRQSRKKSHSAFDSGAHVTGINIPVPVRLRPRSIFIALVIVLLTGAGVYAGYQIKFAHDSRSRAIALTGGDPDLGRHLTQRYGCAGCHIIPGVPGAQGKVGPTLEGFAARVYIGGVATNSPDTLIQWLEDPKSIDPKTAMPVTGISRAEARHVAAYLYSLR
jgi:cytochrome c2